jgi:hypothetical protein
MIEEVALKLKFLYTSVSPVAPKTTEKAPTNNKVLVIKIKYFIFLLFTNLFLKI